LILRAESLSGRSDRALLINPEVAARTGTIQLSPLFLNPSKVLRPAQYARIGAVSEPRQTAHLIAQRAVPEFQGVKLLGIVTHAIPSIALL
jgi:membrane fusion protein, multidrug efflux system